MKRLTLDQANTIMTAAVAKGHELGLKPLTVAVLDPGGHLIALQREDGASLLRPALAAGKAGGALAMGMSSRSLGAVAAERPAFVASLHGLTPGGLVPAAGGVIVIDQDGVQMGAVGVSGDTSDSDEVCALAGIAAVGLSAQS